MNEVAEAKALRITIPTIGSRGDVQPYVALGLGLRQAGHRVVVATHTDFEGFVRGQGLDFFPIGEDGQSLQASVVGNRMVHAGRNTFRFLWQYARLRKPLMNGLMANCLRASRDADLLLLSNTEFFAGHAVAERLGIPTCWTSLQPMSPSFHLANCLFPPAPVWLPGRRAYNLGSSVVAAQTIWQTLRGAVNRARADVLGLPPLPLWGPAWEYLFPPLRLEGYSPHVVPPPPDWGAKHQVTGYWFLDAHPDWKPAPELADFLADERPTVYVGFGSMHNPDAAVAGELVLRALEITGLRGVLFAGWGGLPESLRSDRVLVIDGAPHDWLFPRVTAVVTHGGAGTVGAALRAGVPTVVVPFMSDQLFWARRVHELGAGPRPIPRKQLTAERLAKNLRAAVGDSLMRLQAKGLAGKIRTENGVDRAVGLLEDYVRSAPKLIVPPRVWVRAWLRGEGRVRRTPFPSLT